MSKIKVMLVDDEPLAIEDLQDIVCWEDLGFEVVATAHNGKQALRKYRESQPDLVITDIDMPIMDGISLAKELRNLDERVRIILLTAYSDFNYAREGFRYGVDDYMLKNEIDESTLREKLLQIKQNITKAKRLRSILTQEEISDFLNSTESTMLSETDEYRKRYYCLILEEDFPCIYGEQVKQAHSHLKEVLSICPESIAGCKTKIVVKLTGARALICIEEGSSMLSLLSLRVAAERLITDLKEKYGSSFTCFFVHPAVDLYELKKLYFSVKNQLSIKYFWGCGKAYDLKKVAECNVENVKVKLDLKKLMLLCVSEDKEELLAYISQKYDEAFQKSSYDALMEITAVFSMMLTSILGKSTGQEVEVEYLAKESLPNCFSAQGVKQWMLEKYRIHTDKKDVSRQLSSTVMRAIEYIHENFSDYRLKIDTIAANVGMSSSRLSVLFKKEMNCTVNEYLTSFRIMKAKVLLQEKRFKIYEIATKVGYGSSQYFSQVFYQKVGVVPTEYAYGGYDEGAL